MNSQNYDDTTDYKQLSESTRQISAGKQILCEVPVLEVYDHTGIGQANLQPCYVDDDGNLVPFDFSSGYSSSVERSSCISSDFSTLISDCANSAVESRTERLEPKKRTKNKKRNERRRKANRARRQADDAKADEEIKILEEKLSRPEPEVSDEKFFRTTTMPVDNLDIVEQWTELMRNEYNTHRLKGKGFRPVKSGYKKCAKKIARHFKTERRSEEFLAGYNGKNETKAERNKEPRVPDTFVESDLSLIAPNRDLLELICTNKRIPVWDVVYSTKVESSIDDYEDFDNMEFLCTEELQPYHYEVIPSPKKEEPHEETKDEEPEVVCESRFHHLLYKPELLEEKDNYESFDPWYFEIFNVLQNSIEEPKTMILSLLKEYWDRVVTTSKKLSDDMFDALVKVINLDNLKHNFSKLGHYASAEVILSIASSMILMRQLYLSQGNREQIMLAVTQYCLAIKVSLVNIGLYARDIYLAFRDDSGEVDNVVEGKMTDTILSVRGFIERVYSSPLAVAIQTLILAGVATRWYGKDMRNQIVSLLGPPSKMNTIELACAVLTALGTLSRFGDMILGGASWSSIFNTVDPLNALVESTRELLSYELYDGLPTPGRMHRATFRENVARLLKEGEDLAKDISSRDERKKLLTDSLFKLRTAARKFDEQTKTTFRIPPICIVLIGDSSIGKSKVLPIFPHIWMKSTGRKFDPSQIFCRSRTSDYWDGYLPWSHPFIFYSEIGNVHLDIAKNKDKSPFEEINSLIDAWPYLCDMSKTEDKGRFMANPDMIIIDTNNENMHIFETMYDPAAQLRRLVKIRMRVLDEFRAYHGGVKTTALDSQKSLEHGGNLLDRAYFEVILTVGNGKMPVETVVFEGRIGGLIAWCEEYFTAYIKRETAVRDSNMYAFLNGKHPNGEPVDFVREFKDDPKRPLDSLDILTEEDYQAFLQRPQVMQDLGVFRVDEEKGYDPDHGVSDQIVVEGWKMPNIVTKMQDYVKTNYLSNFLGIDDLKKLSVVHSQMLFLKGIINLVCVSDTSVRLSWFSMILMFLTFWLIQVPMFLTILSLFILGFVDGVTFLKYTPFFAYYDRVSQEYDRLKKKSLYYRGYSKVMDFYRREGIWFFVEVAAVIMAVYKFYKIASGYLKPNIDSSIEVYPNVPEAVAQATESNFLTEDEYNYRIQDEEHKNGVLTETRQRIRTHSSAYWNTVRAAEVDVKHRGDPESLSNALQVNSRYVRINGMATHVLGIQGIYGLINTHILDEKADTFEFIFTSDGSKGGELQETKDVVPRRHTLDIGNDLTLVRFGKQRFRDITCHIYGNEVPIGMQLNGWIANIPIRLESHGELVSQGMYDNLVTHTATWKSNYSHRAGLCGLHITAEVATNASALVGVHCAASRFNDTTYAIRLNKRNIMDGLKQLKDREFFCPIVSEGAFRFQREMPIAKSPWRYMNLGYLDYLGKLEGPVLIKRASELVVTPYFGEMAAMLYDTFDFRPSEEWCRPVMQPYTTLLGEYLSPYNNMLEKLNRDSPSPSYDVLERVVNEYVNFTESKLRGHGVDKMSFIPMSQAVNGIDGDPFMSRINPNTAAGFPYAGKKFQYLKVVDENTNFREANHAWKRDYWETIVAYNKGESYGAVYNCFLKDEPRLASKVKLAKTRMVSGTPPNILIMDRSAQGDLRSLMVEFSDAFCVGIGYNMYTVTPSLVRELTDFSECIFDGDYGAYDLTTPFFIAHAASTVVYKLYERFGYNESALRKLAGSLTDNLYPIFNVNKDLFFKPGAQPSGKYGTAEDNSIRQIVILMYVYYSIPELWDTNFFEMVKPIAYGDDILAAVKPEVVQLFNAVTFSKKVKELCGMEFTSASKLDVSRPYATIDEVTFLKRAFIKHHTGIYVGQLDMNSIYKSMQWKIPSKVVTDEEQAKSSFQSLLWDLFFHCTNEEEYNHVRDTMEETLVRHYHGDRSYYALPSYEHIYSQVIQPHLGDNWSSL